MSDARGRGPRRRAGRPLPRRGEIGRGAGRDRLSGPATSGTGAGWRSRCCNAELGAVLGVERFQREIRTQARLQHPHILPLFDSGRPAAGSSTPCRTWRADRFATGSGARDLCRWRPPLQLVVRGRRGLDYAHALGVDPPRHQAGEHPDLGQRPRAAHRLRHRVRDRGRSGTRPADHRERRRPRHADVHESRNSPVGERRWTPRSASYSLGDGRVRDAWRARRRSPGRTPRSIMARRLVERRGAALESTDPDVPAPIVEAVVNRALARLPGERYETVAEFAVALAAAARRATSHPRRSDGGARLVGYAGHGRLASPRRAAWPAPRAPPGRPGDAVGATGPRMLVVLPFRNLGGSAEDLLRRRIDGRDDQPAGTASRDCASSAEPAPSSIGRAPDRCGRSAPSWARPTCSRGACAGPSTRRGGPDAGQPTAHRRHRRQPALGRRLRGGADGGVPGPIGHRRRVTAELDVALRAHRARRARRAGETSSAEAYDLYLRGNDYLGRSNSEADLANAVRLFRQAVIADPGFAAA